MQMFHYFTQLDWEEMFHNPWFLANVDYGQTTEQGKKKGNFSRYVSLRKYLIGQDNR